MRSFFFKLSFLFLFFTLVLIQPRGSALELSLPGKVKTSPSENQPPLSYPKLRGFLMDFADRYMQMVGQAVDTLQKENSNPDTRGGIQAIKLFPCSAAFSIAIDANPHMALLNMEVLAVRKNPVLIFRALWLTTSNTLHPIDLAGIPIIVDNSLHYGSFRCNLNWLSLISFVRSRTSAIIDPIVLERNWPLRREMTQ